MPSMRRWVASCARIRSWACVSLSTPMAVGSKSCPNAAERKGLAPMAPHRRCFSIPSANQRAGHFVHFLGVLAPEDDALVGREVHAVALSHAEHVVHHVVHLRANVRRASLLTLLPATRSPMGSRSSASLPLDLIALPWLLPLTKAQTLAECAMHVRAALHLHYIVALAFRSLCYYPHGLNRLCRLTQKST